MYILYNLNQFHPFSFHVITLHVMDLVIDHKEMYDTHGRELNALDCGKGESGTLNYKRRNKSICKTYNYLNADIEIWMQELSVFQYDQELHFVT